MVRRTVIVTALVSLLLAGCGGGVYLSYDFGDDDDEFGPDVQLQSDVDAAAPGQPVRLRAFASDFDGIDNVAFYRDDDGEWVLLAQDVQAPYAITTLMPDSDQTRVRYAARATDRSGDRGSSDVVTVDVLD